MPDRPSSPLRISRLRALLQCSGVEAFLILDLKSILYLTGFSGSDGALLVGAGEPILLVDGRYTTQARKQVPGADVVLYRDKAAGIAEVLSAGGFGRVGFEPAVVTVELFNALRRKTQKVRWKPLQERLGVIRAVKDPGEIENIRRAIRIATEALRETITIIRPEVHERDIAIELEYLMRSKGADAPSFDTIVASGPNGALPHARPGSRRIRTGDFVVIDYGAVWRGYHSDETCTFAIGRPGRRHEKVYSIVKEAHDRALEAVRPGIACRDVDAAARCVIEKAGHGSCFSHGTGHGVGLDVHEAPRISTLSDTILEQGMVITIEPGVYLPGFGGVRIEDTVLVEKDGARVLTEYSKELQIIG